MEGSRELDNNHVMEGVHSTVFKESENLEGKCVKIEGYDFNGGVDYSKLLASMFTTGFQASNLGDAIRVVNEMIWSLADESVTEEEDEERRGLDYRKSVRCKVFLDFTSNLISSGIRDTVRFLAQHHMIMHNLTIAEFFRDGCSNVKKLLAALKLVKV